MDKQRTAKVAFDAMTKAMTHIEEAMTNGSLSKTEARLAMASVGAFLTESAVRSLSPDEESSMYFVCAEMSEMIERGKG